MNRLLSLVAAFALVFALVSPASAGNLKLEIRDGRVTLEARDVPVSQILAEWARVGKTRILNGERVPGGLVTLTLVDVPEAKALDIVLRSVSGYLAAPRAERVADASIYDRIVVLATVRAAAAPAAPAAAVDPAQRFRPGMGRPMPAGDQNEVFGPDHPNYTGPNPTIPNPNIPGMDNPNFPGPNNPNFPGPNNPNVPGPNNPNMPGWTPVAPGVYPVEPGTNPTLVPVNPVVGTPGTSPVPGVVIQPPVKPPVKPPGSPGGE